MPDEPPYLEEIKVVQIMSYDPLTAMVAVKTEDGSRRLLLLDKITAAMIIQDLTDFLIQEPPTEEEMKSQA